MMPFRGEKWHGLWSLPGVLLVLLFGVGCDEGTGPHHFTRFSMGTVVDYTVVGVSRDAAREAVDKAHSEIDRVADLLWEETVQSDIHAVNAECTEGPPGVKCGDIAVSDETGRFLDRAFGYTEQTNGAFDVTVGSFLTLYDFRGDSPVVPDSQALGLLTGRLDSLHLAILESAEGLAVHGMRIGARISVGGIAKGYAVDRAIRVLKQSGIDNALINAGGDLYAAGSNAGRPWRVGIRDPDVAGDVVSALEIVNGAVATSGDYQRFFEVNGIRYHHLLDPGTGWPARKARSATVVASSTEKADALATALFVAGISGIRLIEKLDSTEGLLIDMNGQRHETSGFADLEVKP